MSPTIYLILAGIALLLVGGGVAALVRKQRALPPAKERPQLDAKRETPQRIERTTLDKPVDDIERLSLRELKQAKGAKLSESYKQSDAARAQREFRKGSQDYHYDDVDPGDVSQATTASTAAESVERIEVVEIPVEDDAASLEGGLARTRESGFIGRLSRAFRGRETLDDDLVEEIEEVLFTADIGASTSQYLLECIEGAVSRGEVSVQDIWALLRKETESILASCSRSLVIGDQRPFVILFVGVNGVGKTTTIGKLAAQYVRQGKKVLMVAGDTFRAAAVQQLEEWANRVGCGFHAGEERADPSGVIFEGVERATNEGYDIVLADTAGRLHTKTPLVDELKKISRAAAKACDGAPHETLLVLDANTGQNAIQQARLFNEAVDVDGLVLSKLDGTAKGGIILGISRELSLPVYFIGIGEGISDLRPFDAEEFVDALF